MTSSTEPLVVLTPEVADLSETETRIIRIWAELLQRPGVDGHDDYFAMGGDSLLAVKLLARIDDEFGVKLPLSSILEAPTAAEFSRLIETRGSHESVRLIRSGDGQPSVFLVHDGDGETMLYRGLALRLDPKRPVYGLQPRSETGVPILHTLIEEMAAFHVGNIRKIQPHGPYLIGGLCDGGLIAFEMARQLERDGEAVAMVALLDVADVEAAERPMRIAKERLNRLASTFERGKGRSPIRRATTIVGTLLRKARNLAWYQARTRTRMIADRARMALFRLHLKLGLSLPTYLRNISVRTVCEHARRAYRPTTPFGGELLLLRASSGTGDDEPHAARYSDPTMGWDARTTKGVRAIDVPGGHSSILQEPNVQVLAQLIDDYVCHAIERL